MSVLSRVLVRAKGWPSHYYCEMRSTLALLLPALLVAQGTLLQIHVVDGERAMYAPGTRTPGFTVEVTDELGKAVAGAVVSVRLPDDGPGGSFANGLSSEILTTGANGRATTSPLRWNRLVGAVEIRVTAVKGKLRAGTVAACEVTEAVAARRGAVFVPSTEVHRGGGHRKMWIVIAAVAAGAAGAGIAAGRMGGGHSATPSAPPVSLGIGPPTITVGGQ
jgi:hypothetical protein